MDVPEGVMLVGLRVQARPDGLAELVSPTVPVNPLTGVTVTVEVADPPLWKLMLDGLALKE